QNPAVFSLLANTPLLIQIYGVVEDFFPVGGVYRDKRNLGLRFLVQLLAGLSNIRLGRIIQHTGKVVHVSDKFQRRNRFRECTLRGDHHDCHQQTVNNRLAHGLILQTYKTELSQARQDGNGLLYYHDSRSWNRHETVYYNQWVVETIVT